MVNVSDDFIAAIRSAGREIDAKIYVGDNVYDMTSIDSLTINTDGGFPSTAMKSIVAGIHGEFEAPDGVIDDVKIGVRVGDEYEYISYGKFFLLQDGIEYYSDTDIYTVTAYDALVFTMTEIPEQAESGTVAVQELLSSAVSLLDAVGINSELPDMTEYNVLPIAYSGKTYRDLLENVAETLCAIVCIQGGKLVAIQPGTTTNEKIELQDLMTASINDDITITGVQFNGSKTQQKLLADETSDAVQVTIDNPIITYIIDNLSAAAINDLFSAVKTNYSTYMLNKRMVAVSAETMGVLWFDVGDYLNIVNQKDNAEYPFIFINSRISIESGLSQTVESSLTSRTEQISYTADSKVKNVTSEINRLANGLQLKVSKGDVVSEINQSEDTISLKANRIEIQSDKFNLSTDGNIEAKSGTIAGFGLSDTAFSKTFTINNVNYKFNITSDTTSTTANYLISLVEDGAGSYSFAVDTKGVVECSGIVLGANAKIVDVTGGSVFTAQDNNGDTFIGAARRSDGGITKIAGGRVWLMPQNGSNCALLYDSSGRTVFRCNTNGAAYLGTASYQWHSIYCSDGAFNGSDRKLKENICDLDDEKNKEFIMALRPVQYNLKSGTGKRTHNGLIAQEVRDAAEQTVGDIAAYQACVIDGEEERYFDPDVADDKLLWQLNYSELISPLIKLVQSQQREIEKLKEELKK